MLDRHRSAICLEIHTWAKVVEAGIPGAYNYKEEGWKESNAELLAAGEVLGTIP